MVCFQKPTVLCAFACLALLIARPAYCAPVDVAAQVKTLQQASSSSVLSSACRALTLVGADRTAAFNAMRTFELSGRDIPARKRCARYLINLSMMESPNGPGVETVLELLKDPNPIMRAGAAKALWGLRDPAVGRALLHVATTDRSSAVTRSAFENLSWSMNADIAENHDAALYESAISRALLAPDAEVVAGALSGYAALHPSQADPLLRHFAVDKRRIVRLGAIDAYDGIGRLNRSLVLFLETRLRDPDAEVRDSVMFRLFRFGDHHAIPLIDELARTAPTR